jgi:hypothetical protein
VKRAVALFSVLALSLWSSAIALDVQSGLGYHSMDQSGAYDCSGLVYWEQLPNGASGFSSQVDVCYPFDSATADNFVAYDSYLGGAGWWGVYWNGGVVAPDAFYVTVYADAGGVPNTPPPPTGGGLITWYVPAPYYNETFSGATEADYCFNVEDADPPVPLALDGGVPYWISFQAVFCFPPQWGWSTGANDGVDVWFGFPLLGYAYWTPGVNVFGFQSSMAFLLLTQFIGTPTKDTTWSTIKNLYR